MTGMQIYPWQGRTTGEQVMAGPAELSAQTDLMVFLDGHYQQAKGNPTLNQKNFISETVADSCVALRIFASATDRADKFLMEHIEPFESLYDHSHLDGNLLRIAGAITDKKQLTEFLETGSPYGLSDKPVGTRTRKL